MLFIKYGFDIQFRPIIFNIPFLRKIESQYLRAVPTHDPNSFTLPTEPFDDLSKLFDLQNLKPFDVKLAVEAEALRYLKDSFTLPGRPCSERCWEDSDDVSDKCIVY
jgi:hypothetical protein